MTTKRRLILHVGQTKAGSTSIQNYLESQHSALLEEGCLFPRTGLKRQNPFDQERTPGHLGFLHGLLAGDTEAFEADVAQHDVSTLLLSIENLFSDHPDTHLSRLAEYFQGWQIDVIAVLRPQWDWLRSRFAEEVCSGWRFRTGTFDDFLCKTLDNGTLDYRARMDHLHRILQADSTRAIRFEDDREPLVVRFLKAVGLPVTDEMLARQIHANRHKKGVALIEAKRRLNTLISDLSVQDRLEVDHRLKEAAKRLEASDGVPAGAASPYQIRLSSYQAEALQAGNDALTKDGTLDGSLQLGKAHIPDADDPRQETEAATARLFEQGLHITAHISRRTQQPAKGGRLCLSDVQIDELLPLLQAHRVSLHLYTPEMADIAACIPHRFVTLFLSDMLKEYRVLERYDELNSVSPVVALQQPLAPLADPAACLSKWHLPRPGLVTAGPHINSGVLRAIISKLAPRVLILSGQAMNHALKVSPKKYHGRVVGDVLVLHRTADDAAQDNEQGEVRAAADSLSAI